jgi:competence ComEA-like helix-hairpin-helix protein
LININTASAEKLQELPGIGPAYSTRIVEWRNKNGHFVSKNQLLEIKGIGEKRLEAIVPLITL